MLGQLPASLLLLTATALATPVLIPRAGGPAIQPIQPPCSISYVNSADPNTTAPATAFRPNTDIATTQIYFWDEVMGDAQYVKEADKWTTCIEQCHGLSGCKAAFLAYNVPGQGAYGSTPGQPSIGCRMFNVEFKDADFVEETNGTYTQAVAANIVGCDA